MKVGLSGAVALWLLANASLAQAQLIPGSMNVHWSEGAANCAASPQPPLQVHPYNARTFILRESLCATFEAPFMYLLTGSTKALLIDTGDVADAKQVPLAQTVLGLLPGDGAARLPLLVVHTHRHLDHRAGDPQFAGRPGVEVVGYDLESVQKHFGFHEWPNGLAQIDLGGRVIDVLPTPGHNATHLSFYDRNTGLFFSGDFLMPGRLLIEDTDSDVASARRAANFVRDRPVSFVLGGHIEENRAGETFPWESQFHPQERALQLSKEDLLALPAIVSTFNGLYTKEAGFTLLNPMHEMLAIGSVALLVLGLVGVGVFRYFRRRRREAAA
ncbi:MAG TPA: MBL fold metallo-hydrolase [Steroidobacteraceae bacterium]